MPKYSVKLKITGYALIVVEAADKPTAVRAAMSEVGPGDMEDWSVTHGADDDAELLEDQSDLYPTD